jgi:uncharacterized membrane protein YdjX (TVP38/TMEM64 family)
VKKKSTGKILHFAAFPVFFLILFLIYFVNRVLIHNIVQSPEAIRDWVESFGLFAPLIFILLQVVQVVIFIIPGEIVQIAGGYLFGITQGLLLSLVGIGAGSVFNFFVARILGRPFVETIFGDEELLRFEKMLNNKKTRQIFFLFFLIPGIPKDMLCYFAGLSSMSISTFLLVSLLGRLPALLGSVIIGDAASRKAWALALGLLLAASILFLAGFLFRKRIQGFFSSKTVKGKD